MRFLTEAVMPSLKHNNIVKDGIQYSLRNCPVRWAMLFKHPKYPPRIDEMAKGLTGTAVVGLGYLLASNGILTGKAAKDKDLRDYNANTGNSPFSIMANTLTIWAQPGLSLSIGVEILYA